MYIGYILRMFHHLKEKQFRVHHLILARAQMLSPRCHLVTARFVPMAITARLIMNW